MPTIIANTKTNCYYYCIGINVGSSVVLGRPLKYIFVTQLLLRNLSFIQSIYLLLHSYYGSSVVLSRPIKHIFVTHLLLRNLSYNQQNSEMKILSYSRHTNQKQMTISRCLHRNDETWYCACFRLLTSEY